MSNTNTFLGTSGNTAIYLGNTPIVSAYCGTNLIFPTVERDNYYEAVLSADTQEINIITKPQSVRYYDTLEDGAWIRHTIPSGSTGPISYTFPTTGLQTVRYYIKKTKLSLLFAGGRYNMGIKVLSVTVNSDFINGDDFYENRWLTAVTLNNTTSIYDNAFSENRVLESVNLDGVQFIGAYAFNRAGLVGTFRIPDSVCYIDAAAFLDNDVYELYVGSGVTELPKAFLRSSSLQYLSLGKNITKLYCPTSSADSFGISGSYMFNTIHLASSVWPTINDYTFKNIASSGTIVVPENITGTSWLEYEPFKSNNWYIDNPH